MAKKQWQTSISEETEPVIEPSTEMVAEPVPLSEAIEPEPEVVKIQVLHDYGGRRTRDLRIEPGIYTVSDARLFRLADYLIANGHAVLVVKDEAL